MRKDFYDSPETDNPDVREGGLFGRLPNLIALALSSAGWARQLAGVDPNTVTSREALAHLPLLRADDWPALRGNDPPFGGFALSPRTHAPRADVAGAGVSSRRRGPGLGRRGARAVRRRHPPARRRAQLLLLSPGPDGFIMESGAHALGCTVIAAGSDDAIAVADVMRALTPRAYVGSPDSSSG